MGMTPTGGSHGNPHQAARIHCHGWQRGGISFSHSQDPEPT
jgi:hypothetical protein